MPEAALIRPGRDDDAPRFIALIERCWADYPGCVLDVDAEAPELRALASYYAGRGGALWIAGEGEGMIATVPHENGAWEMCRVYVHPDAHGTGLGARLLTMAETHAVASGATTLFLWSDTRFERAHRFYGKHGYERSGEPRALHDIAATIEQRFSKAVGSKPTLQGRLAQAAARAAWGCRKWSRCASTSVGASSAR